MASVESTVISLGRFIMMKDDISFGDKFFDDFLIY